MKKSVILNLVFLTAIIFLIGIVTAEEGCYLKISLINQDPYPAIQGDYAKIVFQIDGLENPNCGIITFGLKEDYPIYLDPNTPNPITINSGTYRRGYSSFYLAPYKVRIDENALDGENPIEVYYSKSSTLNISQEFNITVEDVRADFEVNVKSYDYLTRELTFEILNIEKVDVQSLTLEIPKQDNLEIKGANRIVVGDLDSNEYTTADFEAILPKGETRIMLNIIYTDSINTRREVQKIVDFDSSYFLDRSKDQKSQPYFLYVIIILLIGFFVWRSIAKKKREAERRKRHSE